MVSLQSKATLSGLTLGILLAFAVSARAEAREEFHKTYPLSENGTVSLRNVNGGVHVASWDRNEVKVDAVKTADSQEKLNDARIDVTAGSSRIDIRTDYTKDHVSNAAAVEYTITVPRKVRLDKVTTVNGSVEVKDVRSSVNASTVNGKVLVDGAAGDLKLQSVNGALRASLGQIGRKVSLDCVNCEIELTLPSDTQAEVDASTVHGSIDTQFDIPVKRPRYGPGTSVKARLGNGGANVALHTVNGAIKIRRASDGKPVSKVTSLLPEEKESFY